MSVMKIKADKGIILLTSIFIVLLISALGIGYLALVNNQLEMADTALKSTKAFYCAETGIAEAILLFKAGILAAFEGITIDGGTYSVRVVSVISPDIITLESSGNMSNFQRIIQVTLDKTLVPGKIIQQNWEEI